MSAATLVGGDGRAVHAVPTYDAARRPIDLDDHPVGQTVHRATHDALTGLPNRAAVLNHIVDSLRARANIGWVQCSSSISTTSRPSTTRWATTSATNCGDVAPAELATYVVRIERSLSEPMTLGAATVRTQGSIGVTVVAPNDERSAIEILRDADSAMYETKSKRRRRVYRKQAGGDQHDVSHGVARKGDRHPSHSENRLH